MRLLKKFDSFGITRGKQRAELGVWSKAAYPLVKLKVRYVGAWGEGQEVGATYVFLPLFKKPFWQSLVTPLEMVELLVGSHRASTGSFSFEFLFADNSTRQLTLGLDDVLVLYRQMGKRAPGSVHRMGHSLPPAPANLAAMDASSILKEDEAIRAKALQEKEEREKAIEAQKKAEQEARKKAQAAPARATSAGAAPAAAAAAFDPGGSKVGLFYGSTTGNTANVGDQIKAVFGGDVVKTVNVADVGPDALKAFDHLILGVPTWHIGETQEDWVEYLNKIAGVDLKGKKVAIFGLGDGVGYPDTYVDAMEELWRTFKPLGTELVGLWPTDGYNFAKSKALIDGKFMGLVIDIENQNAMTDERVKKWTAQIRSEFGL